MRQASRYQAEWKLDCRTQSFHQNLQLRAIFVLMVPVQTPLHLVTMSVTKCFNLCEALLPTSRVVQLQRTCNIYFTCIVCEDCSASLFAIYRGRVRSDLVRLL
eukprot:TRINITY_DN2912_c0_g1_i2.p1 TRINITY_DN2912_c0_g1~~TRINITY_DN2912_c0_g1_i2.p1  ORF type:complete len:103 (+),score=11.52 TRINITY_DN2912_c0_g1_i2:139-447(+)